MDKETIYDALVFLKRTINISKLLKAASLIEKAALIAATALTVSELMMILKKLKG